MQNQKVLIIYNNLYGVQGSNLNGIFCGGRRANVCSDPSSQKPCQKVLQSLATTFTTVALIKRPLQEAEAETETETEEEEEEEEKKIRRRKKKKKKKKKKKRNKKKKKKEEEKGEEETEK